MNEIFIRRSIREFTEKPVEKEKIENILKAGIRHPVLKISRHGNLLLQNPEKQKKKYL